MMTEIFAQGDLLLDRVPDVSPSGTVSQNAEGAAMVLAEGEEGGHRHAIHTLLGGAAVAWALAARAQERWSDSNRNASCANYLGG